MDAVGDAQLLSHTRFHAKCSILSHLVIGLDPQYIEIRLCPKYMRQRYMDTEINESTTRCARIKSCTNARIYVESYAENLSYNHIIQ